MNVHKQQKHSPASSSSVVGAPIVDIGSLNANELLRDSFHPKLPNKTYVHKIKQFKKWVEDATGLHPTNGKHITRDIVDKFFLLDQRTRLFVQSKNLTQMKDAMQFHADYYEHPPPTPRFIVQSRIVKECIAEHQRSCVGNRLNTPESAHSNLHSDVLSKEEKIMLVEAVPIVRNHPKRGYYGHILN